MGYKVKRIYQGTNLVRPVWKPNANTIAYYPFVSDTLDHSGNGVTLSNTSYLTKQTIGYNGVAKNTGTTVVDIGFSNGNVNFISLWYKVNYTSGVLQFADMDKYGGASYYASHSNSEMNNLFVVYLNSSFTSKRTSSGLSYNQRHHISVGYDGSKLLISKDGVQSTLYNGSGYNFGNSVKILSLGRQCNSSATISEAICESVCWTAQEVLDYYNQTKSNYGL